jgi:foldase protein PrsA
MLSYLRKKMKTIMWIVALLFAATMFYGLGYRGIKGQQENVKKDSVATVDGKEIDHKKYQQMLSRMFSSQKERVTPETAMMIQTAALSQILDYTILLNEAKRHFGAGRGEVNQAIDQIMQANKLPDRRSLEEALMKNMGLSLSDFKESIKDEIIISKMTNQVRGAVTMTPDDLREVKASHILIMPKGSDQKSDFEARAKADELLAKIKKGENFAALAIKYSNDTGSAKKGGDLGYFVNGSMVPEFNKVVFSLRPGEVSEVFKTQYGYHIVKVEDTRLRKIDTKGKDINEVVLAEKQDQAMATWMYEVKKKAKVEINEPLIKSHMLLMKGQLNEAIAGYSQASMDNPANAYIHLFLGDAYEKADNRIFAEAEYNKAADLSGADSNLLMAVGDVFVKMKDKTRALATYRKASLIAGDDKAVHKDLMAIYKKLGAKADMAAEQKELQRIEKKENFEKEIQKKMGN